jgi:hypothetical protein
MGEIPEPLPMIDTQPGADGQQGDGQQADGQQGNGQQGNGQQGSRQQRTQKAKRRRANGFDMVREDAEDKAAEIIDRSH